MIERHGVGFYYEYNNDYQPNLHDEKKNKNPIFTFFAFTILINGREEDRL